MFNSNIDCKALVMGLMMHAKAKSMIELGNYLEVLEVLGMAEELFFLCDKKFLETVDDVAVLQIDIVYCISKSLDML